MKKGRISNTEKEYVKQNLNLDVSKLAKKLDRPVETVQRIIDDLPSEKIPQEASEVLRKSGVYKNSAVMTQSASQISDSIKKKKTHDPSIIHKPYNDK